MLVTKNKLGEVFRFGLVGAAATMIHYGAYWLLRQHIGYNEAYISGYVISFICNFFLTSYFTFKSYANIKRGLGFFCIHLFNVLFQLTLLNIFVGIDIPEIIAPLFVFAIAIPTQFVLVNYLFKSKRFSNDDSTKEQI